MAGLKNKLITHYSLLITLEKEGNRQQATVKRILSYIQLGHHLHKRELLRK
ncbi:MAG: hypothetical protein F6K47_00715 [Symploca sp. SIO2E6]|nr:hypothetical protein [Symploca sp. SIO2E6]